MYLHQCTDLKCSLQVAVWNLRLCIKLACSEAECMLDTEVNCTPSQWNVMWSDMCRKRSIVNQCKN